MRSRNIKPGFFQNPDLIELSPLSRLLFAGLWCIADREGRFEDRPKYIKIQLMPGDNCDIDAMLDELQIAGFIKRYAVDGKRFVQIINFLKHQNPHKQEQASSIPEPGNIGTTSEGAPDNIGSCPEVARLIPDSLSSDSLNLIPEVLSSSSSSSMEIATVSDIPTQQPARMMINEFRIVYADSFGENMPGGCNQDAAQLCAEFTSGHIKEAFSLAARHNVKNLAYVRGILKGNGKGVPKSEFKSFQQQIDEQNAQSAREFCGGVL